MLNEISNNFVPGEVYSVKTSELTSDKNQTRTFFDDGAHKALKVNIKKVGMISPIIATLVDGTLQIVCGERRWRAAKDNGDEFVKIIYVTQENREDLSFSENMLRENLLPMERARVLLRMKNQGYSHDRLAVLMGRSVSTISEFLALNDLPEDIQTACLGEKRYRYSRLLEISKAASEKTQRKMFKSYTAELDGSKTKKRRSVQNGLSSRIAGIITQINKIKIENLNFSEREKLSMKFIDLETIIREKVCQISTLDTSVNRSDEGLHIDEEQHEQVPEQLSGRGDESMAPSTVIDENLFNDTDPDLQLIEDMDLELVDEGEYHD